MKKSPIKRRVRRFYKIADNYRDNLAKEGSAVDREAVTKRQVSFRYTEQQRRAIADKLFSETNDADLQDESLDEIEILVRLTLQSLAHRDQYPIAEELKKRFRGLDKPITQILAVLDDSALEHLKEFVPNLQDDLNILHNIVRTSQRTGRGRPPDPVNISKQTLITRLAEVWCRHQKAWPKRRYRDDLGRDWGPFHRFLDTCLEPANIRVSDYAIREALSQGEK